MIIGLLLLLGLLIGTVLFLYFLLGAYAFFSYTPSRATEKYNSVKFAIPTIGSEKVRDSLFRCLSYHVDKFGDEFDIYCIVDEGSDLQEEIEAFAGVKTVVVPDMYEAQAVAKGRAIQYFIDTIVDGDSDNWYAFIDDDNLVLNDDFLHEISHYSERGYGAMNSILQPRKGDSNITYIMDHIRLLDDLTVFRAFTGTFGKPFVGFHGELLTVRGDVLKEIGFNRESIVEDFAFATELIRLDIPTWQSRTRVSILSPHTITDLLKQRSRWFIGTVNLLRNAPLSTRVLSGLRVVTWSCAVISGPVLTILWQLPDAPSFPLALKLPLISMGAIYIGTYGYGVYKVTEGSRLKLALALPIYPLIEAASPIYAVLADQREFVIIDK